MKRTKKKLLIGFSTILVVAALAFGLFQIVTNNTQEVASTQQTKATEKSDVKNEDVKKADKVEGKKEETVEETKVEPVEAKEEAAKTTNKEQKTESQTVAPVTKAIEPVTKYVNISSLNMRSGPGTNHAVIQSVTEGQAVTITELSDSWSKASVNGKTGWLSSKYLSDTKPVVKTVEAPKQSTTTSNTPAPSAPQNDADKLKSISGNRQLILVTTNGTSSRNATIQTFEKDGNGKWKRVMNVTGFIGKNGFGKTKEGDGKSPIGKFTIGTAFGQKGSPGTKLPWRNITSDDVWVDDPESSLYNTWQSRSATQGQWTSAEDMTHRLYVYGFVINYNTARTPYKGSAIFFHTGSSYTLGCVATSQSNVVSILKWLDPAKNPTIIMTPTQQLANY
ncbi:SH3 domain-containing protein [Robertmurraya kyonggiensis]|uniref:SH3b domain-containing protein n=1 Tax=Robertmurraya kyonggiensis TaxID=1037680 RepID=A0A4U1D309_9BACI|nr:SH3 domain-containing protein [Robertmurraya kyonggiensis]TKC16188.1 hypothetical protein FA727_14625 [Robertmurraya kyonggiensis]